MGRRAIRKQKVAKFRYKLECEFLKTANTMGRCKNQRKLKMRKAEILNMEKENKSAKQDPHIQLCAYSLWAERGTQSKEEIKRDWPFLAEWQWSDREWKFNSVFLGEMKLKICAENRLSKSMCATCRYFLLE